MDRHPTAKLIGLEEVSDKELIRRYCSAHPDKVAGEVLFARSLPKIRKFIEDWGSNHLCHLPRTIDRQSFVSDAESLGADELRRKVCSFALNGSFNVCLRGVAKSAAVAEFLKIVGRGTCIRDFVPLEEAFRSKYWPSPFDGTRNPDLGGILLMLLAEHARSSNRGRKSASVIALATWEGYTAKEIAKHLNTTAGYTWNLMSHDYAKLRELMVEKLGPTSPHYL